MNRFKSLDVLQRLLFVNIAVFILFKVVQGLGGLFLFRFNHSMVDSWLALPAYIPTLITRPWTLITYMFYHFDFWHILFNMLWLYWMGRILMEYLGQKKLFSTYIYGGICGAVLFIASYNLFPLFSSSVESSVALGASAGVLAITIAAATLLPDYRIGIFLIGAVPLKYIALFTILLDLMNVSGPNAGGHIAHLGGALYGFFYIRQLKKGKDLAKGFNNLMDSLVSFFSGRSRMKVRYRKTSTRTDEDFLKQKKDRQERIDEILDKISRSGYSSLTQEEKDFLFKSSKE